MIVDLGCGNAKRGDIGIDRKGPPVTQADIVCNLGYEPIPLEDNFADRVVAYHFVEHLPEGVDFLNQKTKKWETFYPVVNLFNEAYRILKNRGIFYIQVPTVTSRLGQVNVQAFQDPTHRSYWTLDRLNYFSGDYFLHHDTIGHASRFQLKSVEFGCENNWIWCMEAELIAIKDVPEDTPYQLSY